MLSSTIAQIGQGLLAIIVLLSICYLFSTNRKAINWRIVVVGITLQIIFGFLVIHVPFVNLGFMRVAAVFQAVINWSDKGASFIFGDLVKDNNPIGYVFAFRVLPTIIFFSALSSLLYHIDVLQFIVKGLAWFMNRTMQLSGPESLSTAANIFLGQTEAPLFVKPYLAGMSRSELHCIMVGGMATIAGSVFAAYVGFLGGGDPVKQIYFAQHLLAASIMSAPGAIVAAKMIVPETEKTAINNSLNVNPDKANNLLDAISIGTTDGLKLAVNVGAMLLVFYGLVAAANALLGATLGHIPVGDSLNLNQWVRAYTNGQYARFGLDYIFGVLFSPLAWLLGVPYKDITQVGQLLGQKTVINEFVAYSTIDQWRKAGTLVLDPKSLVIATYALCGFSNFASIGIQIGGIGSLAPSQRKNLTELGLRCLLAGSIACFLTAAVAGMMYKG